MISYLYLLNKIKDQFQIREAFYICKNTNYLALLFTLLFLWARFLLLKPVILLPNENGNIF